MKRLHHVVFCGLLMLSLVSAAPVEPGQQPGRYIVVLKDDVEAPGAVGREIARQAGGRLGFVYEHALRGFSIQVPQPALARLQRNPLVKYVVPDEVRTAYAQTVPFGVQRIFADSNPAIALDGSDNRVDADVAVIDTGIDFQHPDLNVTGGVNCTAATRKTACVAGGDDDHYHGTHVAGTIGAMDNAEGVVGVAPGARLWAVKVLDARGSGWSSWVIAGIDWVAANAAIVEVANISLGGAGYSQAEYDAIQGAVNNGVAFAVAAGNSEDDAGFYSPAAFDNVLTVSALADFDGKPGGGALATCRLDQDDTLADFSNWGPAVDIAAPGVCIRSTYPVEKGGYGTLSGTSMASPHVAGALALMASVSKPTNAAGVERLYAQLKEAGNFNWMDDSGDGVREPLLDVSSAVLFAPRMLPASGSEVANTAPTAVIESPSAGATFKAGVSITFAGSASDVQDGDLTDGLIWTSSVDGLIGTGGSFAAALSAGIHVITASVVDSGGMTANAAVSIKIKKR